MRSVVAWQDALDGGASNTVLQSSVALVEGIRLMAFLRGRANNIADVVQRALAFALPSIFVKTFQEQCKVPGRQPSPSILRYHELSFDVAIMLLEQRAWNRKSVRYDWSDSSPQAGYSWLWGQCRTIQDEHLPDIFLATINLEHGVDHLVESLVESREDYGSVHDKLNVPMEPLEEWKPWLESLKLICESISPPAAMSSGHTHNLDISWRLSCSLGHSPHQRKCRR